MIEDKNLTISYELVLLLQWLVEREPEKLKKLIKQALSQGLQESLRKNQDQPELSNDEIQYNIIDFLVLLESLLHETLNEERLKRIIEKKMMPALDNIDGQECDQATVDFSVEKASSRFENHPNENPQDLLFRELLKCWKPNKNTFMH